MIGVSPLQSIRICTPRLELRLGDRQEVTTLAGVAANGVHPPEDMPFAVAWTDATAEPGFATDFVAHHEEALSEWRLDDWALVLIVFFEQAPVGAQAVRAKRFAAERVVDTGSWLGMAWQGRGLGTEMRSAALELAFGPLQAVAARSGWLESGGARSAGVSAKLGYREVGTHVVSPRGVPVVHHDLRLERSDWISRVPIVLEGVEPCLPLFGVPST
jgi:RimJ/RimL family protein N-acetyltransferase